jgi:hypothetical protein
MSSEPLRPAPDLLSTLTERLVGLGIAMEVGVAILDETGTPQLVAATHDAASRLTDLQLANAEGPSHECWRSGLPVSTPDLTLAKDRWPTFTPEAIAAGFRSVHALPLRLEGDSLGAMTLFLAAPGGVSTGGLRVARAMADIATVGLEQQHELDRAHVVESQLQHALVSRVSIEQAKGIISEQAQISTRTAFAWLRGYSRDHNRRLADVAAEVTERTITSDDLDPGDLSATTAPDGAADGARDVGGRRSLRGRDAGT